MAAKTRDGESVVREGGVAREPADAEDVTRDTYGSPQPPAASTDTDERVAQADRAAAAAGMPGVDVPQPEAGGGAAAPPPEGDFQSTDESGDRAASRRDVEELKPGRS